MFSQCENCAYTTPFDSRTGQFFRFQVPPENGSVARTHSVRHFWLCDKCSKESTLGYESGKGVMIRSKFTDSSLRQRSA